jgi:hypothetical protein
MLAGVLGITSPGSVKAPQDGPQAVDLSQAQHALDMLVFVDAGPTSQETFGCTSIQGLESEALVTSCPNADCQNLSASAGSTCAKLLSAHSISWGVTETSLRGLEWTADQADHDIGILRRNYREVVSRQEAEPYFRIGSSPIPAILLEPCYPSQVAAICDAL